MQIAKIAGFYGSDTLIWGISACISALDLLKLRQGFRIAPSLRDYNVINMILSTTPDSLTLIGG